MIEKLDQIFSQYIRKRALDKIKAHIIQNSTCQTIKS